MAVDYSKKKNAELEDLLKARSLPHTGKKADLIARLQASDASLAAEKTSTSKTTPVTTTAELAPEDEIDWDDDAALGEVAPADATTDASATAIAAGGQTRVANPTQVPNQVSAIDPATTNDLAASKPAPAAPSTTKSTSEPTANGGPAPQDTKPTEPASAPKPDFTSGLGASNLTSELEKRAKRAARFGTATTTTAKEQVDETQKALDRAKRFGTTADDNTVVKALDAALPERAARKRGRENGVDKEGEKRGGSRRRVDGAKGGQKNERPRASRNNSRREKEGSPKGAKPVVTGYSDKDKEAAEKRKARFAATKT